MNDKDIKILEEHAQYFLNQEDRQALMNVLERLQELQKQLNGAFDRGFIPVAKIKEKIEELDKEEKQQLKGTKGQDRYAIKQEFMYKRNILQELLEGK